MFPVTSTINQLVIGALLAIAVVHLVDWSLKRPKTCWAIIIENKAAEPEEDNFY